MPKGREPTVSPQTRVQEKTADNRVAVEGETIGPASVR